MVVNPTSVPRNAAPLAIRVDRSVSGSAMLDALQSLGGSYSVGCISGECQYALVGNTLVGD